MGRMVRFMMIVLISSVILSCVVKTSRRGLGTSRTLRIQDIRVAEGADKTIVEIEGEGLMLFTSFRLSDPDRLILEISEVDLGKYRDEIKFTEGPIESIIPIPMENIHLSRLEFKLAGEVKTDVRPEGLNIVVEVTQLGGGLKDVIASQGDEAFFKDEMVADEMMRDQKTEKGDLTFPSSGDVMVEAPPPALVPPVVMASPDVSVEIPKMDMGTGDVQVEEAAQKDMEGATPPVMEEMEPLPPAQKVTAVRFVEGDDLRVIVGLDGSLTPNVFFSDGTKRRIVIDLPGVKTSVEQQRIPGDGRLVQRIRTGKHPDKIRLVLDLLLPVDFSWEQNRDEVRMILKIDPSKQSFKK